MKMWSSCSPYVFSISKSIWIRNCTEWVICKWLLFWRHFLIFFIGERGDSDEVDEGLEDLSDLSDEEAVDDSEEDDSGDYMFLKWATVGSV